MREQEAADLDAGRIRLADLDSDDDEYATGTNTKRGRKKKGRRKKGKKNRQVYLDDECDDIDDHVCEEVQEVAESAMDTTAITVDDESANEHDNEINLPNTTNSTNINDDVSTHDNYQEMDRDTLESESESEPHSWRCECCHKDFKSEKHFFQFDNHTKSKKHKEMLKKYEMRLAKGNEDLYNNQLV